MASREAESDWEDDAYGSDESFLEEDDQLDEPTVDCPFCGLEIHEEAQRCPGCEQYVSDADYRQSHKPLWIVVTVILCLIAILQFYWLALLFA